MSEVKNSPEKERDSRDRIIVRTSVIGIVTNVLLAAFKAFIGLTANSIAVILDAVNNLSDAMSSIITIVGTKLAAKPPDKKHPLGYGRVEYLSAMIVSGIVLYAGITSAVESVKKILEPETPDYSMMALVIIAVAVAVKLVLGQYVIAQGQKVNSGSLIASGSDAKFDAVLSTSVLASAVIYLTSGVNLEAWVGAVISLFIIKSGIEMITATLDDILGIRADREKARAVKTLLNEEPEVQGAYDLLLFNYGPDKDYAAVHLELPDNMSVERVDTLTRRLEEKVYRETGIALVGVGVYGYNINDDQAAAIRDHVRCIVMAHDWVLQFHGFHIDIARKKMRFDAVMSFDVNRKEGLRTLYDEVKKAYPEYRLLIVPDVDVSD